MALTGVTVSHLDVMRFVRDGHLYALEVVLKQVSQPISTPDLLLLNTMYMHLLHDHPRGTAGFEYLAGHIERAKRIIKHTTFSSFIDSLATSAGCRAQ